jgi:hypothetical protein
LRKLAGSRGDCGLEQFAVEEVRPGVGRGPDRPGFSFGLDRGTDRHLDLASFDEVERAEHAVDDSCVNGTCHCSSSFRGGNRRPAEVAQPKKSLSASR